MNILITTGIYPPKIGGPAQYAKNLKESFEKIGHRVSVKTFTIENKIPTGMRHIFFFLKSSPSIFNADMIIALDTYGVGFPTVFGSRLFFKKCIIRTGGDFLWEQYCERHNKKVLFKNFYKTEKKNFDLKERIIFAITRWTLVNAYKVIFSTDWQRDIFVSAYGLDREKTVIIENYYGNKEGEFDAKKRVFVASVRNLVWKNIDILEKVFSKIKVNHPDVELFSENLPYSEFMDKIKDSYASILVSVGDISPNMILDTIRLNKPFICTKEVGIYERIKDRGIFVDPLDEKEIETAVLCLLDKENYKIALEKVRNFSFVHTWEEIAKEFLSVYKK
jgi:glycosyltransferase involved in cell wall biosynthesis